MRNRCVGPALLGFVLSAPGAAYAQQNSDADCAAVMAEIGFEVRPEGSGCFELALSIVSSASEPLIVDAGRRADAGRRVLDGEFSPRNVQPRIGQRPAGGGSLANTEAIPSVIPVSAAAASLAAVGTEAGTDALVALSLNPSIFLGGLDSTASAATSSRLSDLTVFVPVSGLDRDEDGQVDYLGVRLRLNALAAGLGRDLAEEAASRFGDLLEGQVASADAVELVLYGAPDLPTCVDILLDGSTGAAEMSAACGRDVPITPSPDQIEAFRRELAILRHEIDSEYFGLDVRLDFGDPTLGDVPGADGTRIFGGVGYGKRFVAQEPGKRSAGFRAHLGVRFTTLDDPDMTDDSDLQVEAGFGFEAVYPTGFEPVRLVVGLDGRFGDPPEEALEEEFEADVVMLRGSLSVPFTISNAVTLSFGTPLMGDVTPVLSVSTNFGLLLPDR